MAERHLVSSPAGNEELVPARPQSLVASNGSTPQLEHTRRLLDELRAKYSTERRELVIAIGDQIREMKIETTSLCNAQMETDHKLDLVRRRLTAMEGAVEDSSTVNVPVVLENCAEKLNGIDSQLQKCVEETELLKSAVLHDRMRREDMQRFAKVEDEELEMRVAQLEEANAGLDTELDQLRTTYADVSDAAMDLITAQQDDPPTSHMTEEIRRIHNDVVTDLERIRNENAEMTARMETITTFCGEQEEKREQQITALEGILHRVEAAGLPNQAFSSPAAVQFSASSPPPIPMMGHQQLQQPQFPAAGPTMTFQDIIAEFYMVHNPAKLEMVERIMAEYAGAEEELMDALEAHYGAFGYFRRKLLEHSAL